MIGTSCGSSSPFRGQVAWRAPRRRSASITRRFIAAFRRSRPSSAFPCSSASTAEPIFPPRRASGSPRRVNAWRMRRWPWRATSWGGTAGSKGACASRHRRRSPIACSRATWLRSARLTPASRSSSRLTIACSASRGGRPMSRFARCARRRATFGAASSPMSPGPSTAPSPIARHGHLPPRPTSSRPMRSSAGRRARPGSRRPIGSSPSRPPRRSSTARAAS